MPNFQTGKASAYNNPQNPLRMITPNELSGLSEEEQICVMRQWFNEHYENPVHRCPYNSREGGYLFIHGGPFETREELEAEFSEQIDQEVIDELIEELEEECDEWSGIEDDYDDGLYEVEAALDESVPKDAMLLKLKKLEKLLEEKPFQHADLQDFQGIMIFSFCITTLETYLATIFIKAVIKYNKFKVGYIQAEKDLSQQKFSLTDIIHDHDLIDSIIKSQLAQTTFHNLGHAKMLFQKVFNLDLGDISRLKELVKKRHNFVHHAGQDPIKGNTSTTVEEIEELITSVRKLCSEVDEKMMLLLPPPF